MTIDDTLPTHTSPVSPEARRPLAKGEDPLGIDEIDFIEILCANSRIVAFFLRQALGLELTFYKGPETGNSEKASYVLQKNKLTLVLSTPLRSSHPLSALITKHGDTVRSVAFRVQHCEAFFDEAVRRGAQVVETPQIISDDTGEVRRAAIQTYGDVLHEIVERKNFPEGFWPGFVRADQLFSLPALERETGLLRIDHVVGNVELGRMETWVKFYESVLGFQEMLHFSDEDISTEYSALMSKVMRNGNSKIKFPINEPAKGKRRSQIDEYLEFHGGPGVQHIALLTGDIVSTVRALKAAGLQFLHIPTTYYADLQSRTGIIEEDYKDLAELGILVDRDDDGYLLQIFSKPIHDRPTLFFEIIQRRGSQGFGAGNFKALFEAIEREQALRGNL